MIRISCIPQTLTICRFYGSGSLGFVSNNLSNITTNTNNDDLLQYKTVRQNSVRHGSELLTDYKRGRGGRSSFSGLVITVFGASGFIGRYVVNALAKIGCQVILPYRCEGYRITHLKVLGDLGQVQFIPFHLQDEDSIRKSMLYSNAVVNLIGAEYSTKSFSLTDVNIDGCRRIARITKELGIQNFLHFSALNAQENPPGFYKRSGSDFLRTKYYGELAVKEEMPEAIIFRQGEAYGHSQDRFLTYYGTALRRTMSWNPWQMGAILPLWKHGTQTVKAPVYVGDVSQGVANALRDPSCAGRTFDIVGPHHYRLDDLMDYWYGLRRWPKVITREISPFFRLKYWLLSLNPFYIYFIPDRLERDFISDAHGENPTLEDVGVKMIPIEERWKFEAKPWRNYNYYYEIFGEYPDPPDPIRLNELPNEPQTIKEAILASKTRKPFGPVTRDLKSKTALI